MMTNNLVQLQQLEQYLCSHDEIELAILIGSRATGHAKPDSDWDIAIRWKNKMDAITRLKTMETFKRSLANHLKLAETHVDLIDLSYANLTMKAVVAEEGVPLKGGESLAWMHFLQRTWRELEEFYWDELYAAENLSS